MPTYRVRGMHMDTGAPVDRTITASSEAEARAFLSTERVAVERVESVNESASASDAIVAELRALRAEQRETHAMIERTLTRRGPFFRHMRAYARSSVASGVIIALVFVLLVLFLLSVILSALTVYSLPM